LGKKGEKKRKGWSPAPRQVFELAGNSRGKRGGKGRNGAIKISRARANQKRKGRGGGGGDFCSIAEREKKKKKGRRKKKSGGRKGAKPMMGRFLRWSEEFGRGKRRGEKVPEGKRGTR